MAAKLYRISRTAGPFSKKGSIATAVRLMFRIAPKTGQQILHLSHRRVTPPGLLVVSATIGRLLMTCVGLFARRRRKHSPAALLLDTETKKLRESSLVFACRHFRAHQCSKQWSPNQESTVIHPDLLVRKRYPLSGLEHAP